MYFCCVPFCSTDRLLCIVHLPKALLLWCRSLLFRRQQGPNSQQAGGVRLPRSKRLLLVLTLPLGEETNYNTGEQTRERWLELAAVEGVRSEFFG